MSEIQNFADISSIKYIVGGFGCCISIINALIIYIFRNGKNDIDKDIEEVKKMQTIDHDRLNKIDAEHGIYHPKNGNSHDDH